MNYDTLPQSLKDVLGRYEESKRIAIRDIKKLNCLADTWQDGSINIVYQVGDMVQVSEPMHDDSHNYSFVGHIAGFNFEYDYITVEDTEGNRFELEPHQIELYEE